MSAGLHHSTAVKLDRIGNTGTLDERIWKSLELHLDVDCYFSLF
ncbi:MAG: hypothetical protein AB7V54_05940 [Parabacteroides sp.]